MAIEHVTRFLDLTLSDKIIAIRENDKANSSFILSTIIGKCVSENDNICLFITQNTLGHFNNVGRLLGYDLLTYMKSGKLKIIDLLKEISNIIISNNIHEIVTKTFKEIIETVESMSKDGRTTFIFEDLSQLFNLGLNFKDTMMNLKICAHLSSMDNVRVVVNCHVSNEESDRLCNFLFHMSYLGIIVSALKTGISRNVTGSLEVMRPIDLQNGSQFRRFYHYKLEENDIKIFTPGVGL